MISLSLCAFFAAFSGESGYMALISLGIGSFLLNVNPMVISFVTSFYVCEMIFENIIVYFTEIVNKRTSGQK